MRLAPPPHPLLLAPLRLCRLAALQGTLPVLNADVVRKAVLAGLALHARVALSSKFDRKQYFYPDLPKGYQISQYDVPLCEGGWVEVVVPDAATSAEGAVRRIGITRAHLEEDAGKLVHGGAASLSGSEYSLVDYNRAGVPLLEIVSEPDMRTGAEAAAYGAELRRIMRFLDVSGACVKLSSAAACCPPRPCLPAAHPCSPLALHATSQTATWPKGRCAATSTSRCARRGAPRLGPRWRSKT